MVMKKVTVYLSIATLLCLTFALKCVKNENMITLQNNKIVSNFVPEPDASIDVSEFKQHLAKYPERWNVALDFLAKNDLKSLSLGRTDLNDDVYITVSEYTTKNIEDADYESHKKYIDLQYIVSGEELIGLTRNQQMLKVISPYAEEKDIEFYEYNGGDLLSATPDRYFIFFPKDIHRPCIKMKENSIVKKVVVKIKYQ